MTLFKLRSAPMIVFEDDYNNNILPLLQNVMPDNHHINIFCYEQPENIWRNVFRQHSSQYYQEFVEDHYNEYTNKQCCILIDSINQMVLHMGWSKCLKLIKRLQLEKNVKKILVILHKDCLITHSKLEKHLNYTSNATVSFNDAISNKISVQIKIGNKLSLSEEILSYDKITSVLKCDKVTKEIAKENEPEKPSPGSLSTFKIEVDQTQQLEKHKLQLPYMSKINEGKGQVYYEPDAVDDWDDEDPDDDLDI